MEKDEVVIPLHKPNADEKIFFYICGVIISVPLTLFIYQYTGAILVGLDPSTVALVSAAFFAPFIEEFAKAYPLFYRHGETQRSIFNLALYVGFGFGLVEMLTYVFVLGASPISRLLGLLFHPASTSITAYGIATRRPLHFYMIAVALHFSNDFLALTNPLPFSASIFILGITLLLSWQLHDKTKEKLVA
ncbi:PrsW family intramembrane metalloprotease [Candidatus Bathyarchaeota archaeon A05DMB-2]|jgi:RsiW-degrading membrane proteinase PrsW (M82 family)|nr:PrsW family intramembrane metalloprotease [Candidatus Bathyarchaeota archaeon A05DMB-2]